MKPKRVVWLTVGGIALLSAGCGKHSEAPAQNQTAAPTADTLQVATNSQGATQAATPPPKPDAPDLAGMTRELRRWIVRNQRPPKSFEDFAATAGVQFPPPPAGKKYVIDKTMHVILANR